MSRLTNITAWMLVTLLSGCAGEYHRKGIEYQLSGMAPDAALELLAQQTAQYPDDIEMRSWYMSLRGRLTNEYLTRATVAYRAGDIEQATEWAKKAQNAAPGDDRPRSMLEWIDRQAGIDTSLRRAESVRFDNPEEALAIVGSVLAQQPDNARAARLRDEITTPKAQEFTPKLKRDLNEPITVQFRDQPIISIFELVSNITGLNFTFDKDVQSSAPTTIYASNTPVKQVLDMILQANQLSSKVISDNSILIYPKRPDKETEYKDLLVRTFYLQNAQATQVLAIVKQMVKTRDAVLDERTNSIIMRDAPETIKVAERIITALDVTPAEVVIEAQILEVNATDLLQLGVSYPNSVQFSLQPQGTTDSTSNAAGTLTLAQLRNLNDSDVLVRLGPIGVDFLQSQGRTKVLANPRIRVRNREKAKVLIGDRLPVVTTTLSSNFSTESVNYQDVGLTLDVAPTIVNSDEVQVKLHMEVSNVTDTITTSSGLVAYQIGTRTAETVMSVHNNETQMLAGLLQRNERAAGSGLPGLSRIPLLDRIFGTKVDNAQQTELILLLTPRIVRNQAIPSGNVMAFPSGTDTRITIERDITPANASVRIPPSANPSALPPPPPVPPAPASRAPVPQAPAPGPAPASAPPDVTGQSTPKWPRFGARFAEPASAPPGDVVKP